MKMTRKAIVTMCVAWCLWAGLIMGWFPHSRLALGCGGAFFGAALLGAVLASVMGTAGVAHGLLIGAPLGFVLGLLGRSPFAEATPGGLAGALTGAIVMGLFGLVVGVVASFIGPLIFGTKRQA